MLASHRTSWRRKAKAASGTASKAKGPKSGAKRRKLSKHLSERLGIAHPIFGFSHSIEVLVPQVVQIAGDTPVIAAGGVGHGRHVAAALAMGAQGVWMGTASLTAREHALDDIRLRKVLGARSEDTAISRSHSGKTTRQGRTTGSEEWSAPGAPKPLPMPYQQVLTGDLLAGVEEHRAADLHLCQPECRPVQRAKNGCPDRPAAHERGARCARCSCWSNLSALRPRVLAPSTMAAFS